MMEEEINIQTPMATIIITEEKIYMSSGVTIEKLEKKEGSWTIEGIAFNRR